MVDRTAEMGWTLSRFGGNGPFPLSATAMAALAFRAAIAAGPCVALSLDPLGREIFCDLRLAMANTSSWA